MKLAYQILFLSLAILVSSCAPKMRAPEKIVKLHKPAPLAPPVKLKKMTPTPTAAPPPPIERRSEMIVIDAGHGGKDTGAMSTKHGYEEKDLTLKTAMLVKGYLEELGYPVMLTRHGDTFLPLSKRAELANTLNAALFVSVHYNTCPTEEVTGIEIFYYKDDKNPTSSRLLESKKLGEEVLSTIVKHTGALPRGVKRGNFAVVRETKMPAILIEGGFLSNPQERNRIKEKEYRTYLAWGIARGIDFYLDKKKSPIATKNRPRRELNARPAA